MIPLDLADPDSRRWWEAVARDELTVPECASCRRRFFPPRARCPRCLASAVRLVPVAGTGEVVTWTTTSVAFAPEFAAELPFTLVLVRLDDSVRPDDNVRPDDGVRLDDNVRLLGRLLDGVPAPGLAVRATFYTSHGVRLAGFTPSSPES